MAALGHRCLETLPTTRTIRHFCSLREWPGLGRSTGEFPVSPSQSSCHRRQRSRLPPRAVPRSSRRPTLGGGANSRAPSMHVSGVTVSKLVAVGVRYHATRALARSVRSRK